MFAKLMGSKALGKVVVVDQVLGDVRVGWHCSCFVEGRGEGKVEGLVGLVGFGSVFGVIEERHRREGVEGCCGSMRKFWVDGLWGRSGEVREGGC